ncbi:MAG: hypothetical protein JWN38_570 [Candidatus Saccharibacteria bacterium]|nr:hypothetical protein [Candidatus Saccharibacteria bacterium]
MRKFLRFLLRPCPNNTTPNKHVLTTGFVGGVLMALYGSISACLDRAHWGAYSIIAGIGIVGLLYCLLLYAIYYVYPVTGIITAIDPEHQTITVDGWNNAGEFGTTVLPVRDVNVYELDSLYRYQRD